MKENKSLPPRTLFRQKIILVLFGLSLFFVLLEIGCHIGGFIIVSWRETRNKIYFYLQGEYRVMCIGGSTTVAGGRDSYPSQLEKILNAKNIGIKFTVINKGVESAASTFILAHLPENLDKYAPHMVITMMGENDGPDTIEYEDSREVKIKLFLQGIRVYKLSRLLWARVINKTREIKINGVVQHQKMNTNRNNMTVEESPKIMANSKQDNGVDDPRMLRGQFMIYKNERHFDKTGENFRKAEWILKKAIEIDPANRLSNIILLADCYMIEGKSQQAEELLKNVLVTSPNNYGALLLLAKLYMNCKKFQEAEELLARANEIVPTCTLYEELVRCYRQQGKFKELYRLIDKIIKVDIKNDFSYGLIATLYGEQKMFREAEEYYKKATEFRLRYCNKATRHNYQKIKEILKQRGIQLVCVSHAMRNLTPLKKLFTSTRDMVFVDNEKVFKDAVRQGSYWIFFRDIFGGDFGHCTPEGNRLLAENIANTIIKEVFGK